MSGLVLSGVTITWDGFPVVTDIDLEAQAGRVTALLGPNGVGKTTLLEGISGLVKIDSGAVTFAGVDLTPLSRPARARHGIAHVEQGRSVFSEMSVRENLQVAARGDWQIREAFDIFPDLEPHLDAAAGVLSGGQQQMLVIARALAGRPKMLLLDEMSLGLAPRIATGLITAIKGLADNQGIGVLLVEQYAALALSVADHAYVLSQGRIAYDGDPKTLGQRVDILHGAYLGGKDSQSKSEPSPTTGGK
jgi:branched-chain amino acid transport system ATP-binding protein